MKASESTSRAEDDSPLRFGLWQRAVDLAAIAHVGQTTPDTQTPYFSHPARVAMLVACVFGCREPEVMAAALLHDVLEKTSLNKADLRTELGNRVTEWVMWLSKNEEPVSGPYWDRLASAPWQVRLIKMADAMDHLNGPVQFRAQRIKTARKALALANSSEPEMGLAVFALEQEIAFCEAR